VDGKRRDELKRLFMDCKAGLVFVTAIPGDAEWPGKWGVSGRPFRKVEL
jgi:hypothetical protein